ncbi:type II toxin-antitoxin system PemK/MazF family toxin [Geobacillus sp. Y412MC52]|uniref:type II toxin-antitoxin system PemK/MazF family toxin n=1 Tax=Geobacillus sp. (strain Y412MC52) TaxID=550542 RepID=UPI00018C1B35|nr:type II toxin-antitoxin system PemK/MazF family toxin [Geobacillus sp. Y412MC52]ADU92853.1 hypothetical protein GYMC52_0350 [Geobacillus sp. Y412MC52]
MNVKPGDIYDVYFGFEDQPGGKFRPVLIVEIEHNIAAAVAIKITSKGPKAPPTIHDQYRIEIQYYQEAGLTKKPWARCEKFRVFPLFVFNETNKRGTLHPDDFERVYSEYCKLRFFE